MKGYNKICVKSDCLTTVNLIKDCVNGAPSETIVRKIKDAAGQFEAFKVQFARRETNTIVDHLAKSCGSDYMDVRIIDSPSTHVRKLLSDDLSLS